MPEHISDNQLEALRMEESNLFPEMQEHSQEAGVSYVLFPPSWYFKNGTVTEHFLRELKKKNNYSILSIGVGKAYLERFLIQKRGINASSVTLADVQPLLAQTDIPKGTTYIDNFDMTADVWPLHGTYDFIIAPESMLAIGRLQLDNDPLSEELTPHSIAFVGVIEKMLDHLKPGGRLSISGHLLLTSRDDPMQLGYVITTLMQKHTNIQVKQADANTLIIDKIQN